MNKTPFKSLLDRAYILLSAVCLLALGTTVRAQTLLYQWNFDNAVMTAVTNISVAPTVIDSADGYTGGNLTNIYYAGAGGTNIITAPAGSGVHGVTNSADLGLFNPASSATVSEALVGGVGSLNAITNQFTVTLWLNLSARYLFAQNNRIFDLDTRNANNGIGSHFGATYGVGLVADIMKNTLAGTDLQFRGELLGRRIAASVGKSTPTDYLAGLGLQYNWGGTKVQPKPLDSDGDGVPDDMDKCPGTPAGTVVNADGCEPVKDSDGDGVLDPADKCPNTPAGAKVDANGCELDSDGDGVVDSKDQCPDTPKGDRVDMFGCSFKKEIKLPGVVFDTNSAELRPESYPILDGAAEVLKRYPELKVEVAGHTDSDASDAYNLALSNRRAATVMQYLKDKGAANELKSKGYGERQPIASNKNAEGKAQNRRVVLRVLN